MLFKKNDKMILIYTFCYKYEQKNYAYVTAARHIELSNFA